MSLVSLNSAAFTAPLKSAEIKTDKTSINKNFRNNETNSEKQKVDAQTALANYTIPKINLSFKGNIQNQELNEKEKLNQLIDEYIANRDKLPSEIKEDVLKWSIRNEFSLKVANKIISNEKLYNNQTLMILAPDIVKTVNTKDKAKLAGKILSNEDFYNNENIVVLAPEIINNSNYPIIADKKLQLLDDTELPENKKLFMLLYWDPSLEEDIEKLDKTIGKETADNLSINELGFSINFLPLYKKTNLNELSKNDKDDILFSLIRSNSELFNISDDMRKMFPLIPKNQKEYCSFLPQVVNSLYFETNKLTDKEISDFNKNLFDISNILLNMNDKEFKDITKTITQEYTKDEFTLNVLDKVKNLPDKEKQKVYDYFNFEIYENENASFKKDGIGYSISGYPFNPENSEKLNYIKEHETKKVIENLSEDVQKFRENNKIKCSDKKLEEKLNNIIKALPELRTTIGRIQHGMNGTKGPHQFDVFNHSLKVMQGVVQNPKFKDLNDSDKKIMLLASLLHDIAKQEGIDDIYHAVNSSTDVKSIIKKFNLTNNEEYKLEKLISTHEWLKYANSVNNNEAERTRHLKFYAFHMQYSNLFDME